MNAIQYADNCEFMAVEMLKALKLNWEHTDEDGRTFYCNCPRIGKLFIDASADKDEDHATGCKEAREAIRNVEAFRKAYAVRSAATDLLAACKAAVEVLPSLEVRNWPPGFEMKRKAISLCTAAIAKAEACN